ncbi:prepilin-type N-terminal cleavage/methylation domain-containing protein [Paenibacillus sp. GCM10027627]|uniref:prepilin-type N-terminal cleavage/methylation domain-containing protein n=1 Tax=unclassified Paenibacillus TaxID=185978 RepID=UPI00362F67D4
MLAMLKKNEKGLTLIELLAVLVIVGIIAAIAIPAIGGTISKSKTNADKATVSMIEEVTARYLTDEEISATTTVKFADLVTDGYLKAAVKWQTDANKSFDGVTATYSATNGTWTYAMADTTP